MPTIRNTRITGNSVTAANTNPNSTPSGFGGGVVAFVPALLERVTLSGNSGSRPARASQVWTAAAWKSTPR